VNTVAHKGRRWSGFTFKAKKQRFVKTRRSRWLPPSPLV
jgi:hypothetical protein